MRKISGITLDEGLKMRKWSSALSFLVFVLFAMIGIAVTSVGWRGSPIPEVPPASLLQISSADLDLGEVWLQKELPFQLAVRNLGNHPVAVVDLTASCHCTRISPTAFMVSPSGETIIRGIVDLSRSVDDPEAVKSGFRVRLAATTKPNSQAPLEWVLHGKASRVLDISPPSIELQGANEVVEGTWSPTVELRIEPQVDIIALKPEWYGGGMQTLN